MRPAALREDMVDGLTHESRGHLDSAALAAAMRTVPRAPFVDAGEPYADCDHVQDGTRVLAPGTVARLLEALAPEPGDSVLVVGAGVGYTVALVAELAGPENVQAVDIDRRLVRAARSNLASAGYDAVLVDRRDGADGFATYAPYDRILCEAAAVEVPRALREQLAPGGRLVMPLGSGDQELVVVDGDGVRERLGAVAFQPLLVDGERGDAVEPNRTVREDREYAERSAMTRPGWEREWIDWDD